MSVTNQPTPIEKLYYRRTDKPTVLLAEETNKGYTLLLTLIRFEKDGFYFVESETSVRYAQLDLTAIYRYMESVLTGRDLR